MSYSFDYVATGATAEKQVENTDGRCEVGAPGDAWWLTLIGKGDAKANAKDATMLDVPLWRPAMVVSEAMVNGLMTPPDEMLVLSGIMHAQTLAYTLDNAGTQGFGVGMGGTVSELALAHALGKHAKPLWTGPHVSPWTVYDDDWVAVDNPTFDGEFQWLQGWRMGHIQEGRALRILFILPWLARSPVRSARFRPVFRIFFWLLFIDCIALGYLGGMPAEGIYVVLSRIATVWYFLHFLAILPLLSVFETTRPLPKSISEPVLATAKGAA